MARPKEKRPSVTLRLGLAKGGKMALNVKAANFAPFKDIEELPEAQKRLLKTALSIVEALTANDTEIKVSTDEGGNN